MSRLTGIIMGSKGDGIVLSSYILNVTTVHLAPRIGTPNKHGRYSSLHMLFSLIYKIRVSDKDKRQIK